MWPRIERDDLYSYCYMYGQFNSLDDDAKSLKSVSFFSFRCLRNIDISGVIQEHEFDRTQHLPSKFCTYLQRLVTSLSHYEGAQWSTPLLSWILSFQISHSILGHKLINHISSVITLFVNLCLFIKWLWVEVRLDYNDIRIFVFQSKIVPIPIAL